MTWMFRWEAIGTCVGHDWIRAQVNCSETRTVYTSLISHTLFRSPKTIPAFLFPAWISDYYWGKFCRQGSLYFASGAYVRPSLHGLVFLLLMCCWNMSMVLFDIPSWFWSRAFGQVKPTFYVRSLSSHILTTVKHNVDLFWWICFLVVLWTHNRLLFECLCAFSALVSASAHSSGKLHRRWCLLLLWLTARTCAYFHYFSFFT